MQDMIKPCSIMIIGDSQDNIEDAIRLASSPDVSIKHAMDKEWSIELFDRHPCEVIVLCHQKVENAERFYMSLVMLSEKGMEFPHQVILLCDGKEVDKAYALCRSEIFNDYLIIKPLFDIYRLKYAIKLALHRLEHEDTKKQMEHKLEVLMSKIESMKGDMESYFETAQYADEIKEHIEAGAALSFDSAIEKMREKIVDIKQVNAMSESDKKEFEQSYKKMTDDISKQVKSEAPTYSKYNNWKADLETKSESISDKTQSIMDSSKDNETKIKVLIVEDEAVNQKMMSLILKKEGFDVKVADDGLSAIKLAKKWLPSLIFMDIRMPKMNGLKVTQHLKAIPEFEDAHIIMLTAHDNRAVMKECLKAGASDYLVKPAKKSDIIQRLDLMFPSRNKK